MATKLMRFEVLSGLHHHDDGKSYGPGEVFSYDKDLTKIFTNKFKRVSDFDFPASEGAAGNGPDEDEDDEKTDPSVADKAAALAARGKDVTEKFPLAVKNSYVVFARNKHYSVYEPEETTPLKGCEGLEKVAVEPAIEKLLET